MGNTGSGFYVEQIINQPLSVFSYYIESKKEALIIDPIRDYNQIIQILEKRKAKLKYILETHFHADFVSSHQELAKKYGSIIVFGPSAKANAEFGIMEAKDNQIIKLGNVKIKVMHTPGHTMESSCYVLMIGNNQEHSVYTGDTLFLNETGRPDLAVSSNITSKELAEYLYDSINLKLAKLNDATIVYPGHGSGSLCGKKIGGGTSSTIGEQKNSNYVFNIKKEEFVQIATDNLGTPPAYFFYNAKLNKSNRQHYDEVYKGIKALNFDEFNMLKANPNTVVIDTRDALTAMNTGFIPNSYMIGLMNLFENVVGSLIKPATTSILLVTENDKLDESIKRLSRIGFDIMIKGYLKGGFDTWKSSNGEIQQFNRIAAAEFKSKFDSKELNGFILDIRNESEWEGGIIPNAIMLSLKDLELKANEVLKKDHTYYLHCRSSGRSHVAYSVMKRLGYENVMDIIGGLDKLKEAGLETVKP